MIIINKTVRLVAAPEPPFVGTEIEIAATDASLVFGMSAIALAEGSESFTVDWGDGSHDTFTADAENITHTYPAPGRYIVRVTDDAVSIKVSGNATSGGEYYETYAPMVRSVKSNGEKFTTLVANSWRHCTNLSLAPFKGVYSASGKSGTLPFSECETLTEIHFAAANEEAIKATIAYKSSPTLGASNATVYFDLSTMRRGTQA